MAKKNKAQLRIKIEQQQVRLKRLELSGRLKNSEQRVKLGKAQELLTAADAALDEPGSLQDPEELMRLAEPIIEVLSPLEGGEEEEESLGRGDELAGDDGADGQSRDSGRDVGDTIEDIRDIKRRLDKRGAAKKQPAKTGSARGRAKPVAVTPKGGGAKVAGAGARAAGGAARGAGGLLLKALMHPYVLLALAIIALIVGLIWFITTSGQNKYISQVGGSQFKSMSYDNPEHQAWVERLNVLAGGDDPVIEFAEGVNPSDLLEWKTTEGEEARRHHLLDVRLVRSMVYLADRGWSKIVIGQLASDGPDINRRRSERGEGSENLDTFSAYGLGQAMAIVSIGETSEGLTNCLELPAPIPVRVGWQETAMPTNFLHSVYEPISVQAGVVFGEYQLQKMLMSIEQKNDFQARENLDELGGSLHEEARIELVELKKNLGRVIEMGNAWRLSEATVQYATRALDNLNLVNPDKVLSTGYELRAGLADAFRMMQVANMVGWRGNQDDGCRLWRAYEARQNIRQLTLDLMRMPVDLAVTNEEGLTGWDPNWVVKQVVVYSPEDDLDNGLSDTDVFPAGPTSVDMGGLGYDIIQRDNQITEADSHFMALVQDNGVMTKLSTVQLEGASPTGAETAKPELQVEGEAINELYRLWDGEYDSAGRVSYKNFVHVGF